MDIKDERQPEAAGEGALRSARMRGEALRAAVDVLRGSGATDTPDLDAQVLLAHVTGLSRAQLLAFPERPLSADEAAAYAALVMRRARREPVAYLTGHREFMGLDFLTDRRALIPRPETELLVEAALDDLRLRLERGQTPAVADIGTGTGAIAISVAALELRLPRVYATDISAEALALAAENARRLGVAERVSFLQGDLLDPLPESLDVLLANLPYVAPHDAATLPPDVAHFEPDVALYGADDGLGHFRRLCAQAPAHLRPGATLLLEFGYDQRAALDRLLHAAFPGADLRFQADYAGWDRYVIVRTPIAPLGKM